MKFIQSSRCAYHGASTTRNPGGRISSVAEPCDVFGIQVLQTSTACLVRNVWVPFDGWTDLVHSHGVMPL